MDLSAGIHLTPNIRLVRPLARGGMGEVWVADHLTLKIEVAVKVLPERLGEGDEQGAARFAEEAATAARIKSPHVVQTHDSGVAPDGTCYIVMELLEGESLATRLQRRGTLDLPETAAVVSQVGRALSSAHKLDIVHRDVKPENIFVTSTDDGMLCKVLDFGIAHSPELPENWQSSESLMGTPGYLSPEQFKGGTVKASADRWALAVVAYRCLTGRLPFDGNTLGLLSLKVLKGEFVPPSHIRSDLPPAVDAWFSRALDVDPARRFADVRDMAQELLALVSPAQRMHAEVLGPEVVDTLAGTTSPLGLPKAAVGGAVAALVAAGVIVWFALQPEPQTVTPAAPAVSTVVVKVTETAPAEPAATNTSPPVPAETAEPEQPPSAPLQRPPPRLPVARPRPRPVAPAGKGDVDYGF